MARPLIDQHRHELLLAVADAALPVDADEDRVIQALVNLLTNAAKYTPPGGHIRLTAHPAVTMIEVTCEDDGPGISDEMLPTLFEPFFQGPRSIDRRQGGLGLGLSLARHLTELHGGTLTFEPVFPHGSRFVLRVPCAPSAPLPEAPTDTSRLVAATPRRVLLVEDNTDARAMMQTALATAGHRVEEASDGVSALAVATTFKPDVVVLDIGLPGMNGYEVARALRGRYPDLRLIALTGYGQDADAQAAADAGFDAHCTKPIGVAQLLNEIDAADTSAIR